MKAHLKTSDSPKSWPVNRKDTMFLTRPKPGKSLYYSIPLNMALKQIGVANTTKEARYIIQNKDVQVDGKTITSHRYPVGFMDVVTFPRTEKSYRMIITVKGRLDFIENPEVNLKPCKITGKTITKGKKVQINTFDSRSIIVDKDEYKVGDSILLDLTGQKIKENIPFKEGCQVYLIKGNYTGNIGTLKNIEQDKIFVDVEGQVIQTAKKYAYVVGKTKPKITLK